MAADPILAQLVAEVDRATAALRRYVEQPEPVDDLIPLKDAEVEFRRSGDTVRRWARDEALGEKIGGRWYLRRSAIRTHKRLG